MEGCSLKAFACQERRGLVSGKYDEKTNRVRSYILLGQLIKVRSEKVQ